MRKIIGAFVVFFVAVFFRGGDILYGPVLRTWPDSDLSVSREEGGVGSRPSGRNAVFSTPSSLPSSPPIKSLPPDFISHPLLFLSRAPTDSLVLLPGIGPVLAERIAGVRTGKRSFTRWDDLLVVKGIGPKTLDRLKALE